MNKDGQPERAKKAILEVIKFDEELQHNAGFFSKLFFIWTYKLLAKGARLLKEEKRYIESIFIVSKPPTLNPISIPNPALTLTLTLTSTQTLIPTTIENDLYDINDEEKPKESYDKILRDYYNFKLKNKEINFETYLKQQIKKDVIISVVTQVLGNVLQVAGPIFLKLIVNYLDDPIVPDYVGYIYATCIILCFLLKTLLITYSNYVSNRMLISGKSIINCSLFEKIIRLSGPSKNYFDQGKLMNYITMDAENIIAYFMFYSMFITNPIIIIVALIFIISEMGAIGLIAPLIFFISTVLQGIYGKLSMTQRAGITKHKDKRTKLMNENINGIKIIKYYGWEEYAIKQVMKERQDEADYLQKMHDLRGHTDTIGSVSPIFLSVILFSAYFWINGELKPDKAYAVLAYFNLLVMPLRMMSMLLIRKMLAQHSTQRINHFMECTEIKQIEENDTRVPVGSIKMENCFFAWESIAAAEHNLKLPSGKPNPNAASELEQIKLRDLNTLKDINFTCKSGEFIAVIGGVASGKSSFLNSLIRGIEHTGGSFQKNGTIAYVPQTAWLQNASLMNNILFGKEYDEKLYKKVLEVCELTSDLEILPGGDQTEIGEKGVNLSGGQKQRVQIARAVYQDSDIYILDDCLSALDAHVKEVIFKRVIKTFLKKKAVILVTHDLHFMPQTDKIIIFKGGKMVEVGSYLELQKNKDSEFNKLSVEYQEQDDDVLEEIEVQQDDRLMIEQIPLTQQDSCDIPQNYAKEKDYQITHTYNFSQSPVQSPMNEKIMLHPVPNLNPQTKTIESPLKKKSTLRKKSSAAKNCSQKQGTSQAGSSFGKKGRSSYGKQQGDIDLKILEEQKKKLEKGAMINEEARATGSVPFKLYYEYLTSGGFAIMFSTCFVYVISFVFKIMIDWWLGRWLVNDWPGLSDSDYIGIYYGLTILIAVLWYTRNQLFNIFTVRSANKFHDQIVYVIMKSPLYWFDITPQGRILTRVTKDQDDLDMMLPIMLNFTVGNILQMGLAIIMIILILPLFIIIIVISFVLFYKCINFFQLTAREIKRLDGNFRAPVISSFKELINGVDVIRVMGKIEFFKDKFLIAQYNAIVTLQNSNACGYWMAIMSDLICILLVGFTAYFGVLSKRYLVVDSGLIGLALTQVFAVSFLVAFTLKTFSDMENMMNSLVRMKQYIDDNPQESDWHEPKKEKLWPDQGVYKVDKISYRYREELPNVVHGISFDIKKFEKIGIVGRTGSGKSTITLGLLRILEISFNENNQKGSITLDGQDIADIGLHVLRRRVTIIPQEPVLFQGTIKSNIDPFEEFSDAEIVNALKKVYLWDTLVQIVEDQKKNKGESITQQEDEQLRLNAQVSDGGENFSIGQKQLVCVARALIKKPAVLLMDEATASIDELTDHLIQKMIKEEFKDTTVITIAHRLNTIIQYDRIIVLDQGTIKDIDTPLNLILKAKGIFYELISEQGEEYVKKMIYLAENKDKILFNDEAIDLNADVFQIMQRQQSQKITV